MPPHSLIWCWSSICHTAARGLPAQVGAGADLATAGLLQLLLVCITLWLRAAGSCHARPRGSTRLCTSKPWAADSAVLHRLV